MRVEGQGKASDYFPASAQAVKTATEMSEVKANLEKTATEAQSSTSPRTELEASQIEEAASMLNDAMKLANCHLEFQPYEDSGKYQVKVVDSSTKQVIKEIPPDYMLDFSVRFKDALNKVMGLFVDELV